MKVKLKILAGTDVSPSCRTRQFRLQKLLLPGAIGPPNCQVALSAKLRNEALPATTKGHDEMHAHEIHAHEVHAYGVHTHEVHAHEVHAYEVHAHEVHAYEVHVHKDIRLEGTRLGGARP